MKHMGRSAYLVVMQLSCRTPCNARAMAAGSSIVLHFQGKEVRVVGVWDMTVGKGTKSIFVARHGTQSSLGSEYCMVQFWGWGSGVMQMC
jgi:hypothetical protein